MTPYLSKQEKIHFTRILVLHGLLEETIEAYASSKNNDKDYMRTLKTARTYLAKVKRIRMNALDLDACKDFLKHVRSMDMICTPADKVKATHREIKELTGTLHVPMGDFEGLYGGIVQHACGKCVKENWRACPIREFFRKFGILAVDLEATRCPYSYAEAINLDEWAKKSPMYDGENIFPSDGTAVSELDRRLENVL